MDLITTHTNLNRNSINVAGKMEKGLPAKVMSLLKLIGDMAQKKDYAAFVVGGFVRDLLMGVKNFDVDIVIEGDAIDFSREFADGAKASLVIHRKFGTATVVMPWGLLKDKRFKVDVATARTEKYERPAALPEVEFSSLRNDLYRRDFTINAMAVALNKNNFGQLIDFLGGKRHLQEGVIAVLHKDSFIDDPTRIFRAVRFEQRFGFRIEKATERLIKTAIKNDMFGKTEKQRIRDELVLMLSEKDPARAIIRMHQLDELRFIHPSIKADKRLIALFKSIRQACQWYSESPLKNRALDTWLLYLMALFEGLDKRNVRNICDKFVFKRGDRLRILSYKESVGKALKVLSLKSDPPPSRIYRILNPLSYEVILLVLAGLKDSRARSRVKDFLLKYNKFKIKTTGDDLEKLGFAAGPSMGRALKMILYAKIDGKIKNKKEELTLAQRLSKGN